ncbi:calcium/proton exchanger [Pluteus cervinus]|uniref:Calcium/proton exchanger n=1 Tax=Pluteus cervinus TaxID=181527 RepID=A0ACD3AG74_9AGAR|nr:calcium/proton exchanger [Pluteus cervinus]
MGESFTRPARNVENHVLTQPSLPTVVTEDDDEPPSSGFGHARPSQVTTGDAALVTPSSQTQVTATSGGTSTANISATKASTEKEGPKEATRHSRRKGPGDIEGLGGATARQQQWRPNLPRNARIRALFTPTRPVGPSPTYLQSFKAIITYSPLNVCLAFIPISWALAFTHQNSTLVFIFSCLGIIPLAALLGLGTEQIALRTSQSVGGLLNATLGNVVEMIISGIALQHCDLELVQSSLLGGLLSNLLLVLGMAFIVGGFRYHQQEFQPMVAQLNSSLMIVSVISLMVPTAFHLYLESSLPQGKEVDIILQLSRGSAIILILMYVGYLFFQFYSHNHLFLDTTQSNGSGTHSTNSTRSSFARVSTDTLPIQDRIRADTESSLSSDSDESFEELELNTPMALILLIACTALAYVTADHLVLSLEGLVAAHPSVSKEWITLIIIPIIGNAAEHTTAVVVASKGMFDLAMTVAVGSCIQIALFVIPILVLVAWGLGKPLTLLFDPLETLVLFFSVLLVKFSVEDGRSHWMSGMVLIGTYILIALAFWSFPETVRVLQGQSLQALCEGG